MQNISNTKASFVHAFRIAFYQAILIPAFLIATAAFVGAGGLLLWGFSESMDIPARFEGVITGALFGSILIACPIVFEFIFKKLVNRSARLVSRKYMISSAKKVAVVSTLMFIFIAPLIQLVFIPLLIPFLGGLYSVFYALIFFILLFFFIHIFIFYYFTKSAFQKNTSNQKNFTQIPYNQ